MVTICTIRSMDLAHTLGQMGEDILENGKTANVMEKERSYRWTVVKEKGYGPKTKDCDGLMSLHLK